MSTAIIVINKDVRSHINAAAKIAGKASNVVINALIYAREHGETAKTIDNYRDEFYNIALASVLGCTPAQAEAQLKLKPRDLAKGASNPASTHRSEPAHKATKMLQMQWSRARDAAGLPRERALVPTKNKSAAKASGAKASGSQKASFADAKAYKSPSLADAWKLMQHVATELVHYQKDNALILTGDKGSAITDAIRGFALTIAQGSRPPAPMLVENKAA